MMLFPSSPAVVMPLQERGFKLLACAIPHNLHSFKKWNVCEERLNFSDLARAANRPTPLR
jgi:hypothetical protein